MIIDAHVHFGITPQFVMEKEVVLESMDKYGIDYALVSNSESAEVDTEQNLVSEEIMISQCESAKRAIQFARDNEKKIGALLWVKPLTEGVTSQLKDMIQENRDVVHAIKIHPYHSKVKFDDPRVEGYIKLAAEFDMPVMTHTAMDECSHPQCVYNMAKKYPDVNFVMAHMVLGSDNRIAIDMIKELKNLYGDTAWVRPENALQAIKECGQEKIIFGSDNPIDGVDTYAHKEFYKIYLGEFREWVDETTYNMLMCENAKRVYGLKL